jgi:hypothetical protein
MHGQKNIKLRFNGRNKNLSDWFMILHSIFRSYVS